jgi:hypothetical protein
MTWMGFLASGAALAEVLVLLGGTSILRVFRNLRMLAGWLNFA